MTTDQDWRQQYRDAELVRPHLGDDAPPVPADHQCYPERAARPVVALERRELLTLIHESTGRDATQWQEAELRRLLNDAVHLEVEAEALRQEKARLQDAVRNREEALEHMKEALGRMEEAKQHFESVTHMLMRSPSFRVGRWLTLPLRLLRGVARHASIIGRPRQWPDAVRRLRALRAAAGWRGVTRRLLGHTDPAPEQADYADWFRRHGQPDAAEWQRIRERVQAFTTAPRISLLVPVYNTDPELLRETVRSVQAQVFPHWELCIADDCSSNEGTRQALRELEAADERIRVVWRETNGHICAASNSALELVTGDYVALLDHDDLLTPDALYHVAEAVVATPDVGLIYSDEDKIDAHGRLYDPYFKPDWNPDLLRSQNYFNHLTVYRTDVVRDAGGFREGFEGSQDYDLLLRVVDRLDAGQIQHIPRVLYHWRAVAGSEALEAGVKDYTRDAGQRALSEHLQRSGEEGAVIPAPDCPGHWRIRYALPEAPPRASIIIPTRNGLELLTRTLETLLHRTDYPDYEVLVVDNGSDDPSVLGYLQGLEAQERIRVLRDERPFNFSALNNLAAEHSTGGVLVLLNNDVEIVDGDWLRELVSHAVRPGVGAVGARLWFPDDTLQHAGVVLGIGGVAGHVFKDTPRGEVRQFGRRALVQNYSAVTAACLAVRRSVFMEAGGLDEAGLAVAFNDIDFCLKVRQLGYRNVWTPYASMYHHESASRGYEDTPEKQERFRGEIDVMRQRWGELLRDDPAYNPNLTLERNDFALAWPPRRR